MFGTSSDYLNNNFREKINKTLKKLLASLTTKKKIIIYASTDEVEETWPYAKCVVDELIIAVFDVKSFPEFNNEACFKKLIINNTQPIQSLFLFFYFNDVFSDYPTFSLKLLSNRASFFFFIIVYFKIPSAKNKLTIKIALQPNNNGISNFHYSFSFSNSQQYAEIKKKKNSPKNNIRFLKNTLIRIFLKNFLI